VIFNALMSSLEPGDEVIVPAPYWVSYPDIVRLAEGVPVFVDCPPEQGFRLQAESLERAITPRTRWLVLNAPNNPSGAVYDAAQMKALTDVLMRHPQVAVLTDDIYEHVLYDGRRFVTPAQVEPGLKARTMTVNGVSKAYAMTGWRIGYAGGPAALVKAMTKLQSQSTSNPNSVAQAAAIAALDGPQGVVAERTAIFQARRDHVLARLADIPGVQCHRPEGAFYLYPSCAAFIGKHTPDGRVIATDRDFVMHLLEHQNLAVLQGDAYGASPFFRISFATAIETLDEGCARLQRACEALQ
jgi:aspartate aminotransferase